MLSLAKSRLAPVLGQHVPLRGPGRLLLSSYAKTRYQPQESVTRVITAAGDMFEADLSSNLEWQLWAFGSVGKHVAELFTYLVGPGDRCVDVGANVGVHTVRLARLVGPDGEVISIEPDPEVLSRTRRNIAINGLAHARLIGAAASEQAGEMRLYRPGPRDTNRARASLTHHPYLTGPTVMVPVVTVDAVCAGAPVALIKINVAGHEAAVVAGAAGTISAHGPSVVFEYAPPTTAAAGAGAQALFGWLGERGYAIFRIRCARHRITGRMRLAIERLQRPPVQGGDFRGAAPSAAAPLRALTD